MIIFKKLLSYFRQGRDILFIISPLLGFTLLMSKLDLPSIPPYNKFIAHYSLDYTIPIDDFFITGAMNVASLLPVLNPSAEVIHKLLGCYDYDESVSSTVNDCFLYWLASDHSHSHVFYF